MDTTIRDVLRCDGCGAPFELTAANMKKSVNALLGDLWIDFCSRACFLRCMARGGELATGRGRVLSLFGRTPEQHVADALSGPRTGRKRVS